MTSKKVIKMEPTIDNTLPDNAVIVATPLYARVCHIGKLFGMSTTNVYNLLKKAQGRQEFADMVVSIGPGMRLINVKIFEKFIKSLNRVWLTDANEAQKSIEKTAI